MPLTLIASSFVAASRVGGGGQQYALAAFKNDPVLVPTVLFGRHPGKGAPGGAAVEPEVFAGALDAALTDIALTDADALIAGYFASAEQVEATARAIDAIRARSGRTAISGRFVVVVDPIMGDEGAGLYVWPEVADAIVEHLLPRADWLTPNLWELERLTGVHATTAAEAVAAARLLPCPALLTSVPVGSGEIGVVAVQGERATLYAHPMLPGVPRGTGDLVAAVFTAALVEGDDGFAATERAVRAVAETAQACVDWRASELPLVALGARLAAPTAEIRVETLS